MTAPKKFVLEQKKKERAAKKEAETLAKEAIKAEKEALEAAGIKVKRPLKKKVDKEFEKLKREPLPEPKPLDVESVLLGSV